MEWRAKSSNGEGKIVEEIADEVREMVVGPHSVIQAEKPSTLEAF